MDKILNTSYKPSPLLEVVSLLFGVYTGFMISGAMIFLSLWLGESMESFISEIPAYKTITIGTDALVMLIAAFITIRKTWHKTPFFVVGFSLIAGFGFPTALATILFL